MSAQKVADAVGRLARGAEQGEARWKDMQHALPDMKFTRRSCGTEPLGISAGVIEQNFVLANLQHDGRKAGKIAIDR